MNVRIATRVALFLAVLLGLYSCEEKPVDSGADAKLVEDYSYEVAHEWNELFLEIERYAQGYRPGPAPRALAYLGYAAYEACISGMPEYNSLQLEFGLNLPKVEAGAEYHWPTVVNASNAFLMNKFFSSRAADIALLKSRNEGRYILQIAPDVFNRSVAHGTAVAAAVWDWAKTDPIGHDAHIDPFGDYNWQAAYNGPGDWEATLPGPGRGMFPYWGEARAFATKAGERICRPPLPYSEAPSSMMYAQALEVYSQNTPTLSYETEWVGEFWSDDLVNLTFSPGPRFIAIANQVFELEDCNLATALLTNAKVGMALNDAAVACWHSKYHYNVERPVGYIRRIIDATWETNLENPLTGEKSISPSFPAYPSGHSTMSAAGAEALGSVFGYDYAMTDRCHANRTEFEGTPRSFGSFFEMAQENAWSRVPLGVHWRMDCDEGVRFGTEIGRRVNRLPWTN